MAIASWAVLVEIGNSWSRPSTGIAKNWPLVTVGRNRKFLVMIELVLIPCRVKNSCIATWFPAGHARQACVSGRNVLKT